MMQDYKKLVKALRICTGKDDSLSCIDCPYHEEYYPGSCNLKKSSDAADAIEELQAEVERLKADVDAAYAHRWRCRMEQIVNFDEHGDGVITGELVRCRECRWGHLCVLGQHLGLDGFCSKGERGVQE